MTIERMKEIKRALGLTNHDISEITGVPLSTVQKVFGGITRSPRKETILTLEKYITLPTLLDHPYIQKMIAELDNESMASQVGEVLPEYRVRNKSNSPKLDINHLDKQGHYTINDLKRLPDNVRAELIDGVITIMEAPSTVHQKVILYMANQILPCTEKHGCELLIAPVDVQLDCDNKTMVQPDILVTCDKSKDKIKNIYGAPDFVVEICSPSTRKRDLMDKLNKYEHAGVREYWIVDPEEETVTKYDFTEDLRMRQYTFDDKVKVSISDGECEIDFREVKAHML